MCAVNMITCTITCCTNKQITRFATANNAKRVTNETTTKTAHSTHHVYMKFNLIRVSNETVQKIKLKRTASVALRQSGFMSPWRE